MCQHSSKEVKMRLNTATVAAIFIVLIIITVCIVLVLSPPYHEPTQNKQVFSGLSSDPPAADEAKVPEAPKAVAPKPVNQPVVPANPNAAQIRSYWSDAEVGDWVRFMTHNQKIALFEIVQRDGDNIAFEARHFELSGKEIPRQEPDIRKIDVQEDEKIQQAVLVQNPFVVRSVNEWKLYKSNRTLKGDMHQVDNPTGENNRSLSCRDVRCGSHTYQRRGQTPYVILVDYGDTGNPPMWDRINPADLLKYWHEKKDWPNKPKPQEDPFGGEPPEPPEK
jgi:hypothetical protein